MRLRTPASRALISHAAACPRLLPPSFALPRPSSVSTNANHSDPQRKLRTRRTGAWLLAGIVALLFAIIAAQQLFNLGPLMPSETGSDTLLLYALSSLNFAAFMVFSFILLPSFLRLR